MFRYLKQSAFLPLLVLLVTFVSTNQWSSFPIGNTTSNWVIIFLTIISILWCKRKFFKPNNAKDYRIVIIYFIWMLIGVIRGYFVADNYWENKLLVTGSLTLSLPVLVYAFSIPEVLRRTLHVWLKFALPSFGFFVFVIAQDAYHFYFGPVFLLACFLPVVPKKWKIIFIILLVLMIVSDLGARSQVIKAGIALLISVAFVLSKYVTTRLLNIAHMICYIVPIILLFLGISGIFNPFAEMAKSEGKYESGGPNSEDLSFDSRTFIYEEVISSAVRHNYIWQGRTPARGNDSEKFGDFLAEELMTGKYERHANELCHPNIFTWLGFIGMVLYSLIYFKSSRLALNESNNLWMKLLGVYIAFRWAYGWIEDFNRFDIANIALWMMISMGFSEKFRQMNDVEFKEWILNIFKK